MTQHSKTFFTKKRALFFVILLGIVSLFADITYEGARSINGQFLALLGASAFVVGAISGLGELVGFGFRLLSGYITDQTKRYWLMAGIGYIINLLAVPLLAYAKTWEIAALLIVIERFGKSIRTPARDAMLSYATSLTGRGWGFGLHEALDRIGAISGPILMSAVLLQTGSYQYGYTILAIPAFFALIILLLARKQYPRPEKLEARTPTLKTTGFDRRFWLYVVTVSFLALGFLDFPLIAFHLQKTHTVSPTWIPLFYASAMTTDAICSLLLGKLYDKLGLTACILGVAISLFFPLLVFTEGFYPPFFGIILWGIGMGTQTPLLRSFLADIVPPEKRGTAYGLVNSIFGLSWFLGSALMGLLYEISIPCLVLFSLSCQLLSLPLFIKIRKYDR